MCDWIDGYPSPNDDFNPNDINTNKGGDSSQNWRDFIETFPAANGGFSPNDINLGKALGDLLLPHIFLAIVQYSRPSKFRKGVQDKV
ncbi:hypothetical protein [Pseudanabaena sp. BC1403]|uniref:hypothetical protein n=1 Tax=Pseudanabaena sp. BC1403 TaxID=2043171 RepID=UPI000CD9F73E|nr:hypothetical protein [Pseudanabaena sp. BC1403]